jgi:predicted amidohydrolase YtcJ
VADIEETADIALEHGFQLAVHAIGDRANRETLDLYARAFRRRPPKEPPRFRIEHAQLLHPSDCPPLPRAGRPRVHAGHPLHLRRTLGADADRRDRARERAYVWRSLLDAGARVSNGTDTPIEDPDPIANFAASVSRRMGDGRTFYPEQRMTRQEALRSLTTNAAYAAFEEDVKGALTPGRYADITVLSQDLLTVPDDAIAQTKVAATIVGGRVLYEAR